jgi:hypothetical protein
VLHSSSSCRVGCIRAKSQALFGLPTSRSHRATAGPIGVLVLSLSPAVLLLLFLSSYHLIIILFLLVGKARSLGSTKGSRRVVGRSQQPSISLSRATLSSLTPLIKVAANAPLTQQAKTQAS